MINLKSNILQDVKAMLDFSSVGDFNTDFSADFSIGKGLPIFINEKPNTTKCNSFIIINALDLVRDEGVGNVTININVFQRDTMKGNLNEEIYSIAEKVYLNFFESVYKNGRWYTSSSISSPDKISDNLHYINVRIEANYTDLN